METLTKSTELFLRVSKTIVLFFSGKNILNDCLVCLQARSAYFARIFASHPKEFIIDDLDENIFAEIIKFIYNDVVDVTEQNEMELTAAAKKFELKGLLQVFECS